MAIRRYERATPEGTRDLLFEECAARREVESRLSGLFKARGYNRVITPTLEFFDVFDRESAGMPLETLYNITDSHGRLMVLRPDNTLPIARIAATRLREEAIPLRLFYSQNVFRRNPGLTGRRDEAAQSGIELIGASGPIWKSLQRLWMRWSSAARRISVLKSAMPVFPAHCFRRWRRMKSCAVRSWS